MKYFLDTERIGLHTLSVKERVNTITGKGTVELKPGDEVVLAGSPFTTYVVVGLSKVRPTEVFLVRSKQSGRLASVGPKSILEIVGHDQEVPQDMKECHEDDWIVE